jgi:signal transduction histidine kinase
MSRAPRPPNEAARLGALREATILDSPPDDAFDAVTRLAASLCQAPIAVVSLVDKDRQWFKSRIGIDLVETPRDSAFCAWAILGEDVFEVPDAREDARFADNPLLSSGPRVRFYAGAPLRTEDGLALGTLCVYDRVPRRLSAEQRQTLGTLAEQIAARLDLRRARQRLAHTDTELLAAAREARTAIETSRASLERLKSEFIASVSHELRTPLTSIRGALGLLENGVLGQLSPLALEAVQIARSNSDRLILLVNDILDLEKIESGTLTLALAPLDTRRLVEDTLQELHISAEDAKISLAAEVLSSTPIVGDEVRLAQVLGNLVANAIKFSGPGGRVMVRVEDLDTGYTRFSIVDQGQGIAEDDIPRLFNRFQQLDGGDDRQKGGTGLGLALCKAIVEGHGGTIGVESSLGHGSTFWFELPHAKTPGPPVS